MTVSVPELSMGWVRLGQNFAVFDGFGWVGSNMRTVLYFLMISQHSLSFYFIVMKIVFMCSNMIDINCRQFCG